MTAPLRGRGRSWARCPAGGGPGRGPGPERASGAVSCPSSSHRGADSAPPRAPRSPGPRSSGHGVLLGEAGQAASWSRLFLHLLVIPGRRQSLSGMYPTRLRISTRFFRVVGASPCHRGLTSGGLEQAEQEADEGCLSVRSEEPDGARRQVHVDAAQRMHVPVALHEPAEANTDGSRAERSAKESPRCHLPAQSRGWSSLGTEPIIGNPEPFFPRFRELRVSLQQPGRAAVKGTSWDGGSMATGARALPPGRRGGFGRAPGSIPQQHG